jgi:hypothetical protein
MCNTNGFVVSSLDCVGFCNNTNSSIECVFLSDQIVPLLIYNRNICRRNSTTMRERQLVTITETGGRELGTRKGAGRTEQLLLRF